jgi:hypothetical protein
MRNGCCAFLQKPYGLQELMMKVREVLGDGISSQRGEPDDCERGSRWTPSR